MDDIMGQWPSKRIPPGGLFHTHKVQYTPETQKMLKVIMDEAKLTLALRRKMDWCLRSGSSLADLTRQEQRNKRVPNTVVFRPKTSRRRSYTAIKSSGDLERERYRPTKRPEDREAIKKDLQDIMEFGKTTKETAPMVKAMMVKPIEKQLPTKIDMLHDLLTQIQEREEWLQEMEELGEGARHREVIQAQIAERMRKIDVLNISPDYQEDEKKNTHRSNNSVKENHKKSKCSKNHHHNHHRHNKKEFNKINEDKKIHEEILLDELKTTSLQPAQSKREEITQSKEETKLGKGVSNEQQLQTATKFNKGNASKLFSKMESKKQVSQIAVLNEDIRGFSLEGSSCVSSERSERRKVDPRNQKNE